MHIYLGLAVWGVVAFAIYKGINLILVRRQLAGKSNPDSPDVKQFH